MNCPICTNKSMPRLKKKDVQYYECKGCKTLFSGPLNNEDMVGGGMEIERNEQQNQERINRISNIFGGNKNGINILDFGCGHGMLVEDFKKSGFTCFGYDKYNSDFQYIPNQPIFHAVTMVEVIEHLSHPFDEIDLISSVLHKDGILYIETSFTDVAKEENISLEDFTYIEPSIGHSTIFSHVGLDVLMYFKGFEKLHPINRHVRLYKKVKSLK